MSYLRMVIVFLFFFVFLFTGNIAEATDYNVTIRRGQTLNYGLAPGESVTVYYYADGASATFSVWDAAGWYWINAANQTPVQTAMNASWYTFSGVTGQIGNYGIWPYSVNVPMTTRNGMQYKFYIKNYRQGDVVYFQVR